MKRLFALIMTAGLATQVFADTTADTATVDADAHSGFVITQSGIASIAPDPASSKDKIPVFINDKMKIVAVTEHDENKTLPYSIDVTYPQIAGNTLSPEAKKFNQLVVEMVVKNAQQFINYVKADMPHMQTLPDSVKKNTLNINYTIEVLKPGNHILISLRLSVEGMQAGRAHPYHTPQTLNFNLDNGKVLSLKDLFVPRANYLSAFSKLSSKTLNTRLQDKWMIKEGTAPVAKNYEQWNLNKDGILITFQEYQVAPYAAGQQEVQIPYDDLKNLIMGKAPVKAAKKTMVENKKVSNKKTS